MEKKSGSTGNGTVLWEVDHRGVATVTLNRPDVNNAYNGDMLYGLHEAMDLLGAQQGLRVVVLRGNGKHFQAGADLSWINAQGKLGPDANLEASRVTGGVVKRLNELPIPTVAMVQGGCFGGGTGVLAACDIVVAADSAFFAITEARWGLMASVIFPHLVQAIGVRNVRRYALTCERMDAATAQRIGLVHEVCPLDKLAEVTEKIVDTLIMNGPNAVSTTKQLTMKVAESYLDDEEFMFLVRKHAQTRQSEEAAEGTRSFLEKRHPSWYVPKGE